MSHSKPSTTTYQHTYVLEFPWVKEDTASRTSAICTWCKTKINIASMGKTALKSHAKCTKHTLNAKNRSTCLPMDMFIEKTTENQTAASVDCQPGPSSNNQTQLIPISNNNPTPQVPGTNFSAQPTLKHHLLKESVTKSEIFWCLNIVMNHISFRTAARCASNFNLQFPDSEIAAKLKLQRTKVGYTVVFGLAPYFCKELDKLLDDSKYIVIFFDESLNKISQKQQMDIHVRFWDPKKFQTTTRYLTSAFLGHSAASDLLHGIKQAVSPRNLEKTIQISMDGPNVNFKLLTDLQQDLQQTPETPSFLNIGSCGLHTVHGAFKIGMKKANWDIAEFLRAIYYLFKNSPARRWDYTHHTKSEIFPLKFCEIRWIESGNVATRATQMLPSLKKYVEYVEKNKIAPKCNSYVTVKEHLQDVMLGPKLAFFSSIAAIMEPFLREFQTDQPMAPFLHEDLSSLVHTLMKRVVKADVLDKAEGALQKVDLSKSENLLLAKHVDIGFSTREAIRTALKSSELSQLTFRKGCREAVLCIIDKLMEKSPLKYKFTKAISCLDPHLIGHSMALAELRLSTCLEQVVAKRRISGTTADSIKRQYCQFFSSPDVRSQCKDYKRNQMRLDTFFVELFDRSGEGNVQELQDFIKCILTLSHGNAVVERGFSINSECMMDNQQEESLVALRQVYDGVSIAGGIENIDITKEMLHAARNAHDNYMQNLKQKKKELSDKDEMEKRKRIAAREKSELESKKMKIMAEARKEVALLDEQINALN